MATDVMDKMIATKTAYSSVVGQSVSIVSESGPVVALLIISVPNVQYDYKPTADMIADKVVAAFNDADSLARHLLAMQAVVDAARCKGYPADIPRWWVQHNGVIQRAHTIDITVRKDGKFYAVEGDFLKPLAKAIAEGIDGL